MASNAKPLKVNEPDCANRKHADDRSIVRDLYDGTRRMREAKEKYLPRETGESPQEYDARLNRSFCYPGVEDAVDDILGRIFRVPLAVDTKGSPLFDDLIEDVDLCGNNLHRFARDVAQDALLDGICYVLVDMPRVEARTLAEQRAAGARPFFRKIPAAEMLGLRVGRRNGKEIVEQVRIHECASVSAGEFGEEKVEQVRVINAPGDPIPSVPGVVPTRALCTYTIYRKTDDAKDEWTVVESGTIDSDFIPLVAVYTERCEFMRARPPLVNLAWINVAHWQSSSDQRNILRVGRVPILFASGVKQEEIAPDGTVTIGSSRIFAFGDYQANMRYVEHSGAAIEAGASDLKSLEEKMKSTAAELLTRPGDRTATEAAIQTAQDNSWLSDIAAGIKDSFNLALSYAAIWLGLAEDAAPTVTIAMTVDGAPNTAELDALNKARDRGDITRLTYLKELARRNLFAEDFDPKEEAENATEEENVEPNLAPKPPAGNAPPESDMQPGDGTTGDAGDEGIDDTGEMDDEMPMGGDMGKDAAA